MIHSLDRSAPFPVLLLIDCCSSLSYQGYLLCGSNILDFQLSYRVSPMSPICHGFGTRTITPAAGKCTVQPPLVVVPCDSRFMLACAPFHSYSRLCESELAFLPSTSLVSGCLARTGPHVTLLGSTAAPSRTAQVRYCVIPVHRQIICD